MPPFRFLFTVYTQAKQGSASYLLVLGLLGPLGVLGNSCNSVGKALGRLLVVLCVFLVVLCFLGHSLGSLEFLAFLGGRLAGLSEQ